MFIALTENEATVLCELLSWVGGCTSGPRGSTDSIARQLSLLGYVPGADTRRYVDRGTADGIYMQANFPTR